jgi:dTMP kinase
MFIVIEGLDGTGKTTQVEKLSQYLRSLGRKVLSLKDPGSTCVGSDIRELLKTKANQMSPSCELLLFMAARAQMVDTKIKPAIKAGFDVILDRYVLSTLAYQYFAKGKDGSYPYIDVMGSCKKTLQYCKTSATIVLTVSDKVRKARLSDRGTTDAIEKRDDQYFLNVKKTFETFEWDEPGIDNYIRISSDNDIDSVADAVASAVIPFMSGISKTSCAI